MDKRIANKFAQKPKSERKDKTFSLRIQGYKRDKCEAAVKVLGGSLNDFVVDAAYEKACVTVQAEESSK